MSTSTNLVLPYLEVGQLAPETTLNTSFAYLDDAVAGYATKSVAGSSNVTLTETEARSLVLEFTGLLTGSINVVVPTREQAHVVFNNTTGAYTLTVKTSGGSGIAVTQASHALLYCNGTNVIAGPGGSGAGVSDGDKGDLTVSSSGTVWSIDNDVVTYAKMQNVSTTDRLLGRDTAGAGDVEELTLSAVLDFVGSAAQGDVLYRGAATWTRLGAGTSGHFLQTQGAGANPQWASAGGLSGLSASKIVYATGAAAAATDASLSWDATNDILGVIATAGGTSGVGLIALGLGTVPTTGPADTAQIFAIDEAAGFTGIGFMAESAYKHLFSRQTILGSHTRSSNATQGLVIDQATSSDGILQLRSTGGNVAHGMTSIAATDIWGDVRLVASSSGGIQYRGLTEATIAHIISALQTTEVTTKSTSADAPVIIEVGTKSGTSVTGLSADVNMFAIQDRFAANPTKFIVDSDGDTWQPGSATWLRSIEANTAGSGSPNILVASTENLKVLTNEGATARNYHTLPSASAGQQFTFISQDADLMRITANAGDTIRVSGGVSSSGGYIENGAQGDVITLIAINATEWIDVASRGTWTPA